MPNQGLETSDQVEATKMSSVNEFILTFKISNEPAKECDYVKFTNSKSKYIVRPVTKATKTSTTHISNNHTFYMNPNKIVSIGKIDTKQNFTCTC